MDKKTKLKSKPKVKPPLRRHQPAEDPAFWLGLKERIMNEVRQMEPDRLPPERPLTDIKPPSSPNIRA